MQLWSAKDVSIYLGVHVQTVWSWAREGAIPCFNLEGKYRFRQSEIDSWLEKKRQKSVFHKGGLIN